jgi:LuxR family transcriptional regulator, regulator of acetate metabolism
VSTSVVRPGQSSDARPVGERELQRRFAEFVADARTALDTDFPTPELNASRLDGATSVVAAVALVSLEQLGSLGARSKRVPVLCDLALRGAELDADLRDYDLTRRKRVLAGVESALGRLRCMVTPDELVDSVCTEVVRSCGFSRAMLSRVEDDTWMPWMAYFQHREIRESDREWMSTGRIALAKMMLEREVLEESRAAFAVDARADARTSREFVEAVGTSSYAVAPIVPAGRVIGFLHADHYPSTRPVDEVDCHILGHFAEAFGRIYERAVLLARLHRQHDHVRETLKTAETLMDSLSHAEVELVRSADQRSSAGAAATLVLASHTPAIDELLTIREREVIALLVTGQTNSAIAERLVISEGTVKSHVKQILRKLGAVNRSEVIARYLGMIGAG